MIKIQNTIQRGYIVLEKKEEMVTEKSIQEFIKLTSLLERRNYVLSNELSTVLVNSGESEIKRIYKEVRRAILLPKGKFLRPIFATRDLEYEDFSFSDAVRQIDVYVQTYELGIVLPKIIEDERKVINEIVTIDEKIKDNNNIKVITVKTLNEFKEDLKDVINMPIVFGEEQRILLEDAFNNNILIELLTEDIKIKENLFNILEIIGSKNIKKVNLFRTANDVLRYALFVSGQNWKGMELYDKFKVSTSQRKTIMSALNKIDEEFAYNDMKPRKSMWLKLGINIHPRGSKYNEFKNSQKLFSYLREGNVPFKTYHQLSDIYIRNKDFKGLFDHLKVNSGYLMRNLLMLIRNSNDSDFKYILKEISNVKLNIKLVMQIKSLIIYQMNNDISVRNFKINGKLVEVDNKPLNKLNEERGMAILESLNLIIKKGLKGKELISGKKVYIDEVLKTYILPTEIRNLSVASTGVIYTPGTRIQLPEDLSFVRLFTAWGGIKSNLGFDIDLSASFMKDGNVEAVTFYSQSGSVAQHSGDFTSCVKWNEKEVTAEYIDIDFKKAVEDNIEYMMTSNFIFGAGGATNDYNTDINCYSGVQLISKARTEKKQMIDISEAFLKIKLAGKFQSHMPMAIDFKTKEIVIMDKYSEERSGGGAYTIQNNLDMFKREYFNARDFKTNMFYFLSLYFESNDIEIVNSIDDADTVIGYNDMVLKDKEFFNISNNLEKIFSLLN